MPAVSAALAASRVATRLLGLWGVGVRWGCEVWRREQGERLGNREKRAVQQAEVRREMECGAEGELAVLSFDRRKNKKNTERTAAVFCVRCVTCCFALQHAARPGPAPLALHRPAGTAARTCICTPVRICVIRARVGSL